MGNTRSLPRRSSLADVDGLFIPAIWAETLSDQGRVSHYGPRPEKGETAAMVAEGLDVTNNHKFIYEVLSSHNILRKRHGAPPLKWNEDCAAKAQLAADNAAAKDELVSSHAAEHGHGQNAFQGTAGKFGAEEAVESWYSEVKTGYTWPAGNTPHIGTRRFSQVVWASTAEVGMACDVHGKGFIYANYWPPGNIEGMFDKNVFAEGTPIDRRKAMCPPDAVCGASNLEAIVSFPGKYQDAWNEMIGEVELLKILDPSSPVIFSSACVFLPEGDPNYGQHAENDIDDTKECFCYKLYGCEKEWGCKWFDLWRQHLHHVFELHQTLVVVYNDNEVGEGDDITWDDLPLPYERNRVGLGGSQVAEVALLKRLGCEFVKKDVMEVTKAVQIKTNGRLCKSINGLKGSQRLTSAVRQCHHAKQGLKTLSLSNASMMEAGAADIASVLPQLVSLEKLILTNNHIKEAGAVTLAQAFPAQMANLQQLWLGSNQICEGGAIALASALSKLPGLQQLWLGGNNIGEAGAVALAQALPRLPHLRKLGLGENSIGEAGARALAQALPQLPTLQGLGLGGNKIGKAGSVNLAAALPCAASLAFLDLSSNNLGEAGAFALARQLQHLPFLRTLDVSNNRIGQEGTRALAEALPSLTDLEVLWLSGSQMGEAGAASLAQVLPGLTSLKRLGLGDNECGEAGAISIAKALREVPTLQSIFYQNNDAGEAGALAWAQVLPQMPMMRRLDFGNNHIGEAGAQAFNQVMREVPKLQLLLSRRGTRVYGSAVADSL